jgi:membrane-associated PAP2 superfamily phosphatase
MAVMVAVFLVLETTGFDRAISHALFYDARAGQWLGGGAGSWWARELLHDDGRWLVRAIAAGALLGWLASFAATRWKHWRVETGFVFLAIAIPVAVVGALKAVTNVDCPWDLAEFGGARPWVALFADRPDYLPHARCFPGAHSSSGFALLCFHFLWRDRRPRRARLALWAGGTVGILFALGQEARGAHFLSHDLVSAILVWWMQWCLYRFFLQQDSRQRVGQHSGGEAAEDVPRPAQPHPRGGSADEPGIQRGEIDAALPVQQHIRHDDSHERAHRRVSQGGLDAVVEPEARPGEQERGARHERRQRETDDDRAQSDAGNGLVHASSVRGDTGGCHLSASVAATMPAMAATNSPRR